MSGALSSESGERGKETRFHEQGRVNEALLTVIIIHSSQNFQVTSLRQALSQALYIRHRI